MAFPLGVIAYPAAGATEEKLFSSDSFRAKKTTTGRKDSAVGLKLSLEIPQRQGSLRKFQPKKHQKSLSARALVSNKRFCGDSSPASPDSEHLTQSDASPDSATPSGALHVYELPETSPRGNSTTRPKHIPIIVPNYVPIAREDSEVRSGSISTSSFSTISTNSSHSGDAARERPRHVEIKIPSWAQPVIEQPTTPPFYWGASPPQLKLNHSVFIDPFADVPQLSPPDMSIPTPESSRTSTMDSTSRDSRRNVHADHSANGSRTYMASSANSSQSSLVGMRAEYESASEAESSHEDDGNGSYAPSQAAEAQPAQSQSTPTAANTTNLSGLVCNVHRTTGKEPHPLVGATTTVLGDSLYVFGGRRLSRTKPQLTSNLYELDLIRRHWTKLDVRGDIPPARYFHSMCTLGDTKLVCYGGMSPAPAPEEVPDAQPEVIVMSDIHIYDTTSRTWTKINTAESPQGRYAHCASILPSSAYFASSNSPMSAVHHNPAGGNPNQGSLGVSLDGTGGAEMVVVGGQDSANHYIEQVSVFNLRSLKWTGTTGMGRSCGAYRSVVVPLTGMNASQIGAGPHAGKDDEDDDEESTTIGSSAPMLIYSNYNFLDVKLELQIRLPDGTLTEKPMQTGVSPPGLRFPNGGIIDNHFVVSGTFLTSSKQEYALWALDLRTLTWSRIDAGGSIFSQGSWNRGVLWGRRNSFVILGNRKRSLVDDYNNRRINFSNMCVVELEAFGLFENARRAEPTSGFTSSSGVEPSQPHADNSAAGRQMFQGAEDLGKLSLSVREMADMDFLAIDGTRIPVNSRLIARRWGGHFTKLLRESLVSGQDTDTATLRPGTFGHPSRNSSITITPSVNSGATTLNNSTIATLDIPDVRSAPPVARSRLFYLPHTAPTLHALLHYMYTSTLPPPPSPLATPQILCSLLQLARPYKVDGLLEAVIERLHEILDGRNAAAIFNAAAMGAGSGEGVQFAAANAGSRDSVIPLRTASLIGPDGAYMNGVTRSAASLRIDTDMANGRNTRNTIRPGERRVDDTDDEDMPGSAATDASLSESEMSLSSRSLTGRAQRNREIWTGAMSSVVGLQKRGLRGLMEGRRIRERGRNDGHGIESARVGLGIA